MTIELSKYYYNAEQHQALAKRANELAAQKGLQVSRWQNNSKNRVKITYMVHAGERAGQSRYQENVEFATNDESRRGGKIYDESDMLNAVIRHINSLPDVETATEDKEEFFNIDERYGDYVAVTVKDYVELNPNGNFEQRYDGIYEDGLIIAEVAEIIES